MQRPDLPRRKAQRIRGYDYALAGAYFVTICVQDRLCLFGTVKNGEVQLSAAGTMIDRAWREIPSQFPSIFLDDYVIMPDHLHGIVLLRGRPGSPERPAQTGLSDVIGAFKSFSTVTYARAVRDLGWPTFAGRLWQRSYYDRAIRGENDLRRIREYIRGNPLRWSTRFGTP